MSEQLAKAIEFAKAQKYKKALPLLKKINLKHPSFTSLELEAICLFNTKAYPLVNTKLDVAIGLAANNGQKFKALTMQASNFIQTKQLLQAAEKLSTALALINSADKSQHRVELCKLYFHLKDYSKLIEHAKKLVNIDKYSHQAMIHLVYSYHYLENSDLSTFYVTKLYSELNKLSPELLISFVKASIFSQDYNYNKRIIEQLKEKYSHNSWLEELEHLLEIKQASADETTDIKQDNIVEKRVAGTNVEIIKLIESLLAQLESMGANIADCIQITEHEGSLSINANVKAFSQQKLISVPLNCMPLLNDFHYEISEAQQLIATPKKHMLNPNANNIMQTMCAIYNQTDKLSQWQDSCPFIALQDYPALLNKLAEAKIGNANIAQFNKLRTAGNFSELLIESFLGSRSFSYTAESLKSVGIHTQNKSERGLLAVIDFLNHSMDALGYQLNNNCIQIAAPNLGCKGELFVRYNLDDPLITFLVYGFVDINAPWLYSVPCKIDLPNGIILEIQSTIGAARANLVPKELQDCGLYYPPNISRVGKHVTLANIIITKPEHRSVVRRVLSYILKLLDIENQFTNPSVLERVVLHIEYQLAKTNLLFWNDVQSLYEDTIQHNNTQPKDALLQLKNLLYLNINHMQNFERGLCGV